MKLVTVFFCLLLTTLANAQQIPNECGQCDDCGEDCGPYRLVSSRTKVLGNQLLAKPFNNVLHIGVKRFGMGETWGTVSFVDNSTLITAQHVLLERKLIRYIELCAPTPTGDNWITLYKDDFDIYFYQASFNTNTDVALIRIRNKDKLQKLYRGHFSLAILPNLTPATKINLTGFPCDMAGGYPAPDTLSTKSCIAKDLLYNSDKTLVGYPMFTCTGDSGSPLWYEKDGINYVVGIHHGGNEDREGFQQTDVNISVLINKSIMEWYASIAKDAGE